MTLIIVLYALSLIDRYMFVILQTRSTMLIYQILNLCTQLLTSYTENAMLPTLAELSDTQTR